MKRLLASGGAVLALAGCETDSKESEEPSYPVPNLVPTGEVVAEVGPVKLTTDELEERIRLQNPLVRTRLGDPEELRRFVDSQVRNELLALVGWEKGFFDDPEVQRAMRQAVVRKVMSRVVADIDQEIEVTRDEIVELYEKREDQYFRPERIRVGRVFMPADGSTSLEKTRARFERLAKQIRTRQKSGHRNAFDEVAREITGETGAKRTSIDMGFMSREEAEKKFGSEVANRLFDDMTVGDVTVVELENGVAILGKTGRRGEVRRSLESVKPSLVSTLRSQKRSELIEKRIQEMAEERGIRLEVKNLDAMAFGKVPADPGEEERPER